MSRFDASREPTAGTQTHLVERVREGDRQALAALFDEYAPRVLAFARAMLGSREDAEEVVTDAFVAAFRSARDLRSSASFGAWMMRVARNQCLERLRRPRMLTLPLDDGDMPRDWELTSTAEFGRIGLRLHLEQALDRLETDHREVLLLRDALQLSARETADVMGRSEGAVRSLHLRARRALRQVMDALEE